MEKILTVYYSLKGETIAPGMKIVNLEKGYTAMAAEFIQQAVGGELFEIETVKTYIADHMKMIHEAKEELERDIHPTLKNDIVLDDYNTIILCYPNWWNTLPMPVVSFLEAHNWTGKRIIPFSTSGGGGLGRSVEDLKKYAHGANIAEGGTFVGHTVAESQQEIVDWAKKAID